MLKDDAYRLIKQRMFELDLVSGQFVTQAQVSDMIGIPLGPVREAMSRLQSEGMVEILPQRGVRISPVTEEMVRDLFGLRRLLEVPGMQALVKSGDAEMFKDLLRATRQALRKEKAGELGRLSGETFLVDQRLHEMAIAALGNAILRDFYLVQQDRLRLIRLNIRTSSEREPGLVDHIDILEAACRRDVAGAVRFLLKHLDNVEKRALEMIGRMTEAAAQAGQAARSARESRPGATGGQRGGEARRPALTPLVRPLRPAVA